mgnify:CR=1 FL=1
MNDSGISPIQKYRFRSMKEVHSFLIALTVYDGNEQDAKTNMKNFQNVYQKKKQQQNQKNSNSTITNTTPTYAPPSPSHPTTMMTMPTYYTNDQHTASTINYNPNTAAAAAINPYRGQHQYTAAPAQPSANTINTATVTATTTNIAVVPLKNEKRKNTSITEEEEMDAEKRLLDLCRLTATDAVGE